MLITSAALVCGFALLVLGGETLVRGSVSVANRAGVSPLLIGLTVVGFGTSSPELLTSVQAALLGSPGIAVGNVVGSNIANILLILGFIAVIHPVHADPRAFYRDGSMVAISTIICTLAALTGEFTRLMGIGFIAFLIGYIVLSFIKERNSSDPSAQLHTEEAKAVEAGPHSLPWALALTVGGLIMTLVGARLLVDASIDLARAFGISETVIGLTLVALGTSLPELVTAIVAAIRHQPEIAFGNVIGSCIYNLLGILGVTAIVLPIPVPPEIVHIDLWIMLAATAAMLIFTAMGWRLSRPEGAVLLVGYGGYIAWMACRIG